MRLLELLELLGRTAVGQPSTPDTTVIWVEHTGPARAATIVGALSADPRGAQQQSNVPSALIDLLLTHSRCTTDSALLTGLLRQSAASTTHPVFLQWLTLPAPPDDRAVSVQVRLPLDAGEELVVATADPTQLSGLAAGSTQQPHP